MCLIGATKPHLRLFSRHRTEKKTILHDKRYECEPK